MKLSEFRRVLESHPDSRLEFVFDDGDAIPAEFHITEVGHVRRRFIDCGGTQRNAESVLLQAWVSPRDPDHRLAAGKLAGILEVARSILPDEDLPVEVEYEHCVVSQYAVAGATPVDGVVRFQLADKHTDCLAKEACGLEPTGCCGSSSGSCC